MFNLESFVVIMLILGFVLLMQWITRLNQQVDRLHKSVDLLWDKQEAEHHD